MTTKRYADFVKQNGWSPFPGKLWQRNYWEHIVRNIFSEGELDERVVVRNFRTTTRHGAMPNKTQSRDVQFYNLDMIISVGY